MLVHPWDAPLDDDEWRSWLSRHDFGQLIAPGAGRDLPVVVPTHFLHDGATTVRLHLARPNPVWPLLAERPRALLTVVDDYAYVPADWQAAPGTPPELGVPTSYYATVQLSCDVRIVDDRPARRPSCPPNCATTSPGAATPSRSRGPGTSAGCCPASAGWS